MTASWELLRLANVRHLRARPLRTAITVAGVAAAVALAVAVGIVSDTLDHALSFGDRDPSGAADVEVLAGDAVGLPQSVVPGVRAVPGVRRVAPVVRGVADVRGPAGRATVLVLGIERGATLAMANGDGTRDALRVRSGSADPNGPDLLVPPALAARLGARVGATVTFASPAGRTTVPGLGTVAGPALRGFASGRVALLRLAAAQRILGRRGRVDALYLDTGGRDRATVTRAVARRLRGRALVGRPGTLNHDLEQAVRPLGTLASLAAVAAYFVALCLVHNTLTVALAERRRELSTMLALGARRAHVAVAFLLEGALVGAVAAALGAVAGVAAGRVLVDGSGFSLPLAGGAEIVVSPLRVGLAGVAGVAIAVLAAAAAVVRVARLTPLSSLRPLAPLESATAAAGPARRALVPVAAALAAAAGAATLSAAASAPGREWLAAITLALWLVVTALLLPAAVAFGVRVLRLLLARAIGPTARVAFDSLARNRRRSALTAGTVAVTTGLLIAVTAASDSYRADYGRKAAAASGAPLYVVPARRAGPLAPPLAAALARRLRAVPGVGGAYGERSLLVRAGGRPALLTASAPQADGRAWVRALRPGEVAVSRFTARQLRARPGARIAVATPGGPRALRVAALFDGTTSFGELQTTPATLRAGWRDRHASRIAIVPSGGVALPALAARLRRAVAESGSSARVVSGRRLAREAVDELDGVLGLSRAVQLACLAVALLAVVNTMLLTVIERRWELALERTLGMSRGEIAGSLAVEAGAIGYLGGWGGAAFGTAAGYAMTRAMDEGFGWSAHFELPLATVVAAIAGSALVAALAALPAMRSALRASIATTLRGDAGYAGRLRPSATRR